MVATKQQQRLASMRARIKRLAAVGETGPTATARRGMKTRAGMASTADKAPRRLAPLLQHIAAAEACSDAQATLLAALGETAGMQLQLSLPAAEADHAPKAPELKQQRRFPVISELRRRQARLRDVLTLHAAAAKALAQRLHDAPPPAAADAEERSAALLSRGPGAVPPAPPALELPSDFGPPMRQKAVASAHVVAARQQQRLAALQLRLERLAAVATGSQTPKPQQGRARKQAQACAGQKRGVSAAPPLQPLHVAVAAHTDWSMPLELMHGKVGRPSAPVLQPTHASDGGGEPAVGVDGSAATSQPKKRRMRALHEKFNALHVSYDAHAAGVEALCDLMNAARHPAEVAPEQCEPQLPADAMTDIP